MRRISGRRDLHRILLLHSSQCTYLLTILHIMIPQSGHSNCSDSGLLRSGRKKGAKV